MYWDDNLLLHYFYNRSLSSMKLNRCIPNGIPTVCIYSMLFWSINREINVFTFKITSALVSMLWDDEVIQPKNKVWNVGCFMHSTLTAMLPRWKKCKATRHWGWISIFKMVDDTLFIQDILLILFVHILWFTFQHFKKFAVFSTFGVICN